METIAHVIITLIAVYLTAYLSNRHAIAREYRNWYRTLEIMRIKDASNASDKFYSAILRTLEGLYPDTNSWGKDISDRLKQSIPTVELAVTEFKRFVTCKTYIENALKDYKTCCHETTSPGIDNFVIYGEKVAKDPREVFKARVGALLEFAKKP